MNDALPYTQQAKTRAWTNHGPGLTAMTHSSQTIDAVIKHYWGYDSLRPLQREAMSAVIEGQDSLAVMPTGGGKSLCYQAPALLADRMTVVVSPLIALMKDQVDGLLARGIPAAFLNSSLDAADRRRVTRGIESREYKLLFVAPERFASQAFVDQLARVEVGSFAIDEAHCISHWGHDFRVDYRELKQLRERFPDAAVHAFTATATPRVREDIVAQLGLVEPRVLVGDFFRPNLCYHVQRRDSGFDQIHQAVFRRAGQAGIVYCIRRADVDAVAGYLENKKLRAAGYHAGLSDEQRTRIQDAFIARELDVIVATVAFGMGIDRPDIRYVIHAAMPKTIEHYQQETGRAGRDGKPSDCILFYSGAEYQVWRGIVEKEAPPNQADQLALLSDMYNYCTGVSCRHRRLVTYFGQSWERATCEACDVCLGLHPALPDSRILAQKIMSCVARTDERFGATYVAEVLQGELSERVQQRGHTRLSTFGLMAEHSKQSLMAWMDQLVDQHLLAREGEYRVLRITSEGWRVLRNEADARLYDAGPARKARRSRKSRSPSSSQPGPTRAETPERQPDHAPLTVEATVLFQKLREIRRHLAEEQGVPAFMICSDRTLRDMARRRPKSTDEMLEVYGIGRRRCEALADHFLPAIRE